MPRNHRPFDKGDDALATVIGADDEPSAAGQGRLSGLRSKLQLLCTGRGNFGALLQTMVTRVMIFAFNIGSGVVTARGLGADGRGMLAALLTWPQFIAYLLTFGIVSSFMFNVKKDPGQKNRFFGSAIILALAAGTMAMIVGDALMPHLLHQYSAEEVATAQKMMAAAPAILLALTAQTAAEAAADFHGANVLRALSVGITFVANLAFLLLHALSPATAAASYLVPQIPLTVWLLLRLNRHYRATLNHCVKTMRQIGRDGLRYYPHEFVTGAAAYVGQVMVVTLIEPAAVGWFTVSLSIARLLEIFYSTVATVLLPATAAQMPAEVVEKTARAARLTLLLMLGFALPLFVLLPWLLPLIYGRGFAEAVPIARVLLLEAVLSGTAWVLMQAFLAVRRPGLAAFLQITTVASSLALMVGLVPSYGALGASEAMLAVALGKVALSIGLYRFALGVPLQRMRYRATDFAYVGNLLRK